MEMINEKGSAQKKSGARDKLIPDNERDRSNDSDDEAEGRYIDEERDESR